MVRNITAFKTWTYKYEIYEESLIFEIRINLHMNTPSVTNYCLGQANSYHPFKKRAIVESFFLKHTLFYFVFLWALCIRAFVVSSNRRSRRFRAPVDRNNKFPGVQLVHCESPLLAAPRIRNWHFDSLLLQEQAIQRSSRQTILSSRCQMEKSHLQMRRMHCELFSLLFLSKLSFFYYATLLMWWNLSSFEQITFSSKILHLYPPLQKQYFWKFSFILF